MISDLVGYTPYEQPESQRIDSATESNKEDEESQDFGITLTEAQLFIQVLERTLEFYSCVERLIPVDLMNRVGKDEMDLFLAGYIAPLMG